MKSSELLLLQPQTFVRKVFYLILILQGDEIELPFPTVLFTPVSRNGSSFRKADYNTSMEEVSIIMNTFMNYRRTNTPVCELLITSSNLKL